MPKIMKNGIEYGGGGELYEEGEHVIGAFCGKPLYRLVLKTNITPTQSGDFWNYDVTGLNYTVANLIKCDGVVESGYNRFTIGDMNNSLMYYENAQGASARFVIRANFGGSTYTLKAVYAEYTKESI